MKYQIVSEEVGKRIREKRILKKLTQIDVASHCNIERTNLSRIENGKTNLTLHTMLIICEALDMSIEELFHKI